MTRRRPLPAPLARHLAPRLVLAAAVVGLSLVVTVVSLVHAREARRFEERSLTAEATVVAHEPEDRVRVRFPVGATPQEAVIGVLDAATYPVGTTAAVRYDPARPERAQFLDEPYDLATSLAFAGVLSVLALVGATVAWRRVRRLVRMAGDARVTWAFDGHLSLLRNRIGVEQAWLALHPLGSGHQGAVASVRLLPEQTLPPAPTFPVEVRGDVGHHGLLVARTADGTVLWPSGRARMGDPPPGR